MKLTRMEGSNGLGDQWVLGIRKIDRSNWTDWTEWVVQVGWLTIGSSALGRLSEIDHNELLRGSLTSHPTFNIYLFKFFWGEAQLWKFSREIL